MDNIKRQYLDWTVDNLQLVNDTGMRKEEIKKRIERKLFGTITCKDAKCNLEAFLKVLLSECIAGYSYTGDDYIYRRLRREKPYTLYEITKDCLLSDEHWNAEYWKEVVTAALFSYKLPEISMKNLSLMSNVQENELSSLLARRLHATRLLDIEFYNQIKTDDDLETCSKLILARLRKTKNIDIISKDYQDVLLSNPELFMQVILLYILRTKINPESIADYIDLKRKYAENRLTPFNEILIKELTIY